MKNTYLFFVLIIISCGNDEVVPDGTKIISIKHSENPLGLLPKNMEWEEKIIYDNANNIVKITESASNSYIIFETYFLNHIFQKLTYNVKNDLIFRDSITYLGDSKKIDKVYKFSSNAGKILPLSFIYKYSYNTDDQIVSKETLDVINSKILIKEKYYWKSGNIERKELFRYEPNEFIAYEFFYEYDSKNNYRKSLPMCIDDPLSQTANNITSESYNDYYGDWEALCNPCTTKFKYNKSSLPFVIEASWGSKIDITYQ